MGRDISAEEVLIIESLLNNSKNALITGMEIHNKPISAYKYPTVVILIISAWELLLKAFIIREKGLSDIYEEGGIYTIGLVKSIAILESEGIINKSTSLNLKTINDFRNKFIHFNTEDDIDPIIYSLLAVNVDNYLILSQSLLGEYNIDIQEFNTLPLVFKVNESPIKIAKKIASDPKAKEELKSFVNNIIESSKILPNIETQRPIIYDINVNLQSVKKCSNADIVLAIDQEAETGIRRDIAVHISDDKSAQAIQLSDEEYYKYYCLNHNGLIKLAREKYDFKLNKEFRDKVFGEIKGSERYSNRRSSHPQRKDISPYDYSKKALEVFGKHATLKEKINE